MVRGVRIALLMVSVSVPGLVLPGSVDAQQDGGWDSPRVLDLIREARMRRAQPYQDSGLVNYRADAGGYIYFYLDREETAELTLVKVDQVALEVFWAYPGSTRQRIVGLRDASVLPNRMRYHLDHLTIVQNEFGDVIQLGDGDEVQSVVHPVALNGEAVYQFRLADSLTLRLGGLPEPLRVYEIEVRPVDPAAPGFVGSVFLDAAASDIVRMDFTFTRSSYVDRRLDYIRISLENGLWEGRFWLPYEQRAELRRQLPELDFPAGAVIRAHMRVSEYAFNQELPPSMFRGPTVTAVPQAQRESYAFEEDLYAELSEEGLAADPDLEALREEAAELIGRRWLEGLPRLRVDARGASSVVRFNRTERLHLGLGLSYRASAETRMRVGLGYSFGTEEPSARLGVRSQFRGWPVELTGWFNEPRDLGYPSIAGVMNTFSSAAAGFGAEFGHDYLDTYFVRGGSLAVASRAALLGAWTAEGRLTIQDELAALSLVDGFVAGPSDELDRPLAAIDEGGTWEAALSLHRSTPEESSRGWETWLRGSWGAFHPEGNDLVSSSTFGRVDLDVFGRIGNSDRGWRMGGRGRAGALFGDPPVQRHYLLGGRATVPGQAYRSFVGDRSALLELTAAHIVVEPWLSARVSGAAGWTSPGNDGVLAVWPGLHSGVVGPSLGVGIGIFHDILWLDVYRGLGDNGEWELLLSVDPELWDML